MEKIIFVAPQFTRTWELIDKFMPTNKVEFIDVCENASVEKLKNMGFAIWDDEENENGEVLFLFPGEWYDIIPNGFKVTSISGKIEKFKFGEIDNDIRFGCLPYGILKKKK